jgi:3-oxoacyl-[acyl-carrier-protein] synthase II
MSDRRVVVTGLGVLSPCGNDVPTFWNNVTTGKSGIGPITQFDASDFSVRFAGEVRDFEPGKSFKNPKEARRCDRFTQFAVAVAKEAMEDSGMDLSQEDLTRFGTMIGSGIGGLSTLEEQHRTLMEKGPKRVSPFLIPMLITNMASGLVSIEHGLMGPNYCIVTACATANHCVGEAWRLIKLGEADCFVAGGTEAAITPLGIGGFASMRALSTRNDAPEQASRPFDKDRDGFVMSEGAGVVILEEYEHAKARGAKIYCELAGYGLSSDAHHMSAPHPEGAGAIGCMEKALAHAGIGTDDINYINAHGTSTGLGDIAETRAVKQLFGAHAKDGLMVSSTKSSTGHMLGAAGGVELAACIKAIETGVIPPTINLDNPDPECDLDYVPHTAREARVNAALCNSFGFGGHNASVIVKKLG